jgi:hypothetical protein
MTERYNPNDEPVERELNPLDQARAVAWEAFRAEPAVVDAQRRADARGEELDVIKRFYNDELTRLKLTFQSETHREMIALTARLRVIDKEHGVSDATDT